MHIYISQCEHSCAYTNIKLAHINKQAPQHTHKHTHTGIVLCDLCQKHTSQCLGLMVKCTGEVPCGQKWDRTETLCHREDRSKPLSCYTQVHNHRIYTHTHRHTCARE